MPLPSLEEMPEFHRRALEWFNRIDKSVDHITGVPPSFSGESWMRDRSEIVWYGMDVSREPSVSVECTWVEGELTEIKPPHARFTPDVQRRFGELAAKLQAEMAEKLMAALMTSGSASVWQTGDGALKVVEPFRSAGIVSPNANIS